MGKSGTGSRRMQAGSLALLLLTSRAAEAAELKQNTLDAFERYVRLREAQINAELAPGTPFLWVDRLPQDRQQAVKAELLRGKVWIEKLETLDNGSPIPVPAGIIHHWIGMVFIPGATLEQTLALEEDYDHHRDYFQPEVMRSKILRRDGNDFLVLLRFRKKKVITSILDTEHAVHYQILSSTRAWSRSHTTRIQEVEDVGEPSEHLKPEGKDRGFLWRMNTYWRFELKDGGTYVECQSISLTRDIPTGLGWMIGPLVVSIPRESLSFTLGRTRSAVLEREASQPSGDHARLSSQSSPK